MRERYKSLKLMIFFLYYFFFICYIPTAFIIDKYCLISFWYLESINLIFLYYYLLITILFSTETGVWFLWKIIEILHCDIRGKIP